MLKITVTIITLLTFVSAANLQEIGSLKIGDKAPPIIIEAWNKGEKLNKFKKGHIYLLDFSFIKCKPCIKAIPMLNELQNRYKKDMSVIIVFTAGDTQSDVERFLSEQEDNIEVSVATDGPLRIMESSWMQAADKWGFPTYFLIDGQGSIAGIYSGTDKNLIDAKINELIKELN